MAENFFPFTVPAREYAGGSVRNSPAFRTTFLKHQKQQIGDRPWHGYHVDVLSPTRVRFRVFKMREPMFGGIGDVISEFEVAVPALVTVPNIAARAEELAQMRRQKELDEQEAKIIADYTQEILEEAVGRRLTIR